MAFFSRFFSPTAADLRRYLAIAAQINEFDSQLRDATDDQLRAKTKSLQQRLQSGSTLDDILPEAFAVVREAAARAIGERPFDTQLLGGIALHECKIAEMKTGEGKTLVATMPAYLRALSGRGVHIVTVNDYLAKRDAEWMGRIYRFLGLSVGALQHETAYLFEGVEQSVAAATEVVKVDMQQFRSVPRQQAYAADIVYGTNSEFGFDYLRDNMVLALEEAVQRGHYFCIIDEVDSILIDEARTPLIISGPARERTDRYYQFARLVARLRENEHFNVDEKMQAATLTDAGISYLELQLGLKNLYADTDIRSIQHIEQALKAQTLYQRDRQYVVKENEVIIVDEFTGRLMPGRRYAEGLHQAIEAKENLPIKQESTTLATITIQNYFRLYEHLSGMTGTAATEAEEFQKIYNLDVVVIPPYREVKRQDLPDVIYKTESAKLAAIVQEIKERHNAGQPVLVGTVSIQKNEHLALTLQQAGVPHNLLNAKNHEREAEIIAQAGQRGAVTVATNMAGRGVDIVLGGYPRQTANEAKIKALGGLCVIGTERHEARRIDNQLRGRSGRQGDPGVTKFYLSLEDDLLRIFGSDRLKNMMDRLGLPDNAPIEHSLIARSIATAQKKVEGRNFDIRKHLLEYDDIVNKQRTAIYRKRRHVLELGRQPVSAEVAESDLRALVFEMVEQEIEAVVSFHTTVENEREWNINEIHEALATLLPLPADAKEQLENLRRQAGAAEADARARSAIISYLVRLAQSCYDTMEQKLGPVLLREVEKRLCLQVIDALWIDHLEALAALREGIGLRGYGQRDPLVEYKREAHALYQNLLQQMSSQIAYAIYKVGNAQQAASADSTPAVPQPMNHIGSEQNKVGRNDPCPCGSGKKYKKCHGA